MLAERCTHCRVPYLMFGRPQVRISARRLLILGVYCSFTRFRHEYDGVLCRNRRRQPPQSSSLLLTPSSAIRRLLERLSTFTMCWLVIRRRSHNRVILMADDTPNGRFLQTVCSFTALKRSPCFCWHCSVLLCR